jgi:hypothetical protein
MKNITYDLKPYTIDTYQLIIDEFTAYFSQNYRDMLSLYQFGNTSHPSVSDLDLAIVIDEKACTPIVIQKIINDAKDFTQANEERRYIFEHDILIYTYKSFSMHSYIHFTSNLNLLYGTPIKLSTISHEEALWDLRFISYATNILKNFERIEQKKTIGLRQVLKILQKTYHEFKILEQFDLSKINNKKKISNEIKQMRSDAAKVWSKETEQNLLTFYDHLHQKFKILYEEHMSKLAIKLFHSKFNKSIIVLENNHFEQRDQLFIELAAHYAEIFRDENNCYAKIHQKMFPLHKQIHTLDPIYEQLIRKQAQALLPACQLSRKYGATQVLGPMMCYHCSPLLNTKQKLVSLLQWCLFRLQGL